MHYLLYVCAFLMTTFDGTLSDNGNNDQIRLENQSPYNDGLSNFLREKEKEKERAKALRQSGIITSFPQVDDKTVAIGEIVDELKKDDCCIAECSLADFLLDSYFEYGSDIAEDSIEDLPKKDHGTHIISMLNCGVIVESISKGQISKKSLSPYSIVMGSVILLGSEIKNMIEKAVSNYDGNTRHTEFLQVSGLNITIDPSQPPGNRLQSAYVKLANQELKDNEEYSVIMSKDMKNTMSGVYGLDDNLKFVQYSQNLLDRVVYTMDAEKTISKKTDGRIKILP